MPHAASLTCAPGVWIERKSRRLAGAFPSIWKPLLGRYCLRRTGALLQQLRHQESQLDRLVGVEARVAMRVVAVLQLLVA